MADPFLRDPFQAPPSSPELRYNLATGLLCGKIDGEPVNGYASSGGRGGSTTPGALNWWLANNPFATHVKLQQGNRASIGGPLPLGRYSLSIHERKSDRIRLTPHSSTYMGDRDGMLIHRTGPRGSDGCIVPTDFAVVQQLCRLVRARQDAGGPRVVLEVFAEGSNLDEKLLSA